MTARRRGWWLWHVAARHGAADQDRPGRRGEPGRRGAGELGQGAGGPARPGPRDQPAGAGRARPGRRDPRAGAGLPGARHGRRRPARHAAAPVETAVYFAVAEALANAAKHAGASQGAHQGSAHGRDAADRGHRRRRRRCRPVTRAPGCAASSAGWATFDGVLAVSSPPGGPTIVVIEVPCALSSPKTCSC